jgi:hypothetical protein
MSEVKPLTQAIELVAAGSWAVDTALRRLEEGDVELARKVLTQGQATMRDGLAGLGALLETSVREAYDRPSALARALESLDELRDMAPRADTTQPV